MTEKEKEMDGYRKFVAEVMASAAKPEATAPRVFDNLGTDHAKIVIEAMLRSAQRKIRVYAQCLNTDVYDAALLREFHLRHPDGEVEILVEKIDVFQNPESALNGCGNLLSTKFQVRTTEYRGKHLQIVDNAFVRVETSQDARKAIIGYGVPELMSNASELFDTIWAQAQPVEPHGPGSGSDG